MDSIRVWRKLPGSQRWAGSSLVGALVVSMLGLGGGASAAAACGGPLPGGEWPVYGKDITNTRAQVDEDLIGPGNVDTLTPAWVFSGAAGTIESTPMVAHGCVYFGTQTGEIFALDADSGQLVWKKQLTFAVTTLSVAGSRVFANVAQADAPQMIALDAFTGDQLWESQLDDQQGSETTGSPVAFADKVMTGVSCGGSDGSGLLVCRGTYVILDQATGDVLFHGRNIPDEDFARGYSGGGMWAAPSIDLENGYAYLGTGNPQSNRQHAHTNALLKVDIDRTRPTFGAILTSYRVDDNYVPLLGSQKPCAAINMFEAQGPCFLFDSDWAMPVTIFEDSIGRQRVAGNHSAGLFFSLTADSLELDWSQPSGPPGIGGARSGGGAYDGSTLYTAGGAHLVAFDKDFGRINWIAPVGANTFAPVAYANGVVYTLSGAISSLLAFDAASGMPLLVRPMVQDIGELTTGTQAAGVSIAYHTIFAPVNANNGGRLVAYRL